MINTDVTLSTWQNSPEFLHFLQFEFDLNLSSPKVRREVLTLLPLAVGDQRMYGSIAGTVLREAIRMWNQPVGWHLFDYSEATKRWRYLGRLSLKPKYQVYRTVYGRMRRSISTGSYCRQPSLEVIRATEGSTPGRA